MIHHWSPRREQSFVPVNCGALAAGVIESELFGHEKGAFTSASNRRIGYFEMADKGTLLLDEIGTTDQQFQVKLLRALQEKVIYRVGGAKPIPLTTRIVAASNQNLEQEAKQGLFRSDLYFRLGVVTIHVPPLRDRREDIGLLAEHFIGKYQHINPQVQDVSTEGFAVLQDYDYPGNVRELENVIERAMILETSTSLTPTSLLIQGGQYPVRQDPPHSGATSLLDIEEVEKAHILKVLEQCQGKKLEAARRLGINKTTLWRKLKKYGI
jgi:transcriptional regulator with PAS, ATPase and Fis domain